MNVEIRISDDVSEPFAVIYVKEMNDEIAQTVAALKGAAGRVLTVFDDGQMVILQPKEIFLIRTERQKVLVYTQNKCYTCPKRLYEIEELLGAPFMRISKSALVNLNYLKCVEPFFNGTMLLKLKNGCEDYVSRMYLPSLKKYLGI